MLEVDQDILDTLLNEDVLLFQGQPGTNAAVCTNTMTKQLRQVMNSNTCLMIEPQEPEAAEPTTTPAQNNVTDDDNMLLDTDDLLSPPRVATATTPADDNKNTIPGQKQHVIDLHIPPRLEIQNMVGCLFDLLPPPTTDAQSTFQQLVSMYPQNKQFGNEQMKLLTAIYKEDTRLYYKLVNGFEFHTEYLNTNPTIAATSSTPKKSLYNKKSTTTTSNNNNNNNSNNNNTSTNPTTHYAILSNNPQQLQNSKALKAAGVSANQFSQNALHRGGDYFDDDEEDDNFGNERNIHNKRTPRKNINITTQQYIDATTTTTTQTQHEMTQTTPHKKQRPNALPPSQTSTTSTTNPAAPPMRLLPQDVFTMKITKNQHNPNITLTSHGFDEHQNATVQTLFQWTGTTQIPALYGYTLSELLQTIQLSKYQLMQQLSTYPMIMLENKYSLITFDVMKYVLEAVLDSTAVLRAKADTPTARPVDILPPNKSTGLITSTPSLILHRNLLLHDLEYDNVADPTTILSVLLHFIDWEMTYEIYNPNKADILPPGKSVHDVDLDDTSRAKLCHNYAYYRQRYGGKRILKSIKPTNTIANNYPECYQDFDTWSYYINDLLNYPHFPTEVGCAVGRKQRIAAGDDTAEDEERMRGEQLGKEIFDAHITPRNGQHYTKHNAINNIPPIFALSMSKVVQFITTHVVFKHFFKQQSSYDTSSMWGKLQNSLPHVEFSLLLKELGDRLNSALLPDFTSILIDLAGMVIVHDPVYTPQHGYHPMWNEKAKKDTPPQYPLSFNVDEFSERSTVYLLNLTLHYPQYYQLLRENNISLTHLHDTEKLKHVMQKTILCSLIVGPKDRFSFIFKDKKQWAISTIKPFLEAIVSYDVFDQSLILGEKQHGENGVQQVVGDIHFVYPTKRFLKQIAHTSIDALLLKFARIVTFSVRDAKGEMTQTNVVYGPR